MFKALIIAGCSVISIHKIIKGGEYYYYFDKDDRNGPGMQWAAAPLDNQKGGPGGNEIASRMGKKLAEAPNDNQADNWMRVHYDIFINESDPHKRTYSAALRNNSFLYVEYSGTDRIEEEKIDP